MATTNPILDDQQPEVTGSTSSLASLVHYTEDQWTSDQTEVVKNQLNGLRLDLRHLQVEGVAGNLLLWWIHPVQWLGGPVLEAAEALVPVLTQNVPYSDCLVRVGLGMTQSVAHSLYGITASRGLVSSSSSSAEDDYDSIRVGSQLYSLRGQTDAFQQRFLDRLYEEVDAERVSVSDVYQSLVPTFHPSPLQKTLARIQQGFSFCHVSHASPEGKCHTVLFDSLMTSTVTIHSSCTDIAFDSIPE
jgi:hypothetical protein